MKTTSIGIVHVFNIIFLIFHIIFVCLQATIADPDDKKPEDWDKPEHIPDPAATKPDDWDDEMDGEWEPPMIDNSDYKGEWSPKQVIFHFIDS